MITINSLEELEIYKVNSQVINANGIKNLFTYEFKEHGKLADLTLNIEIPFGVSDLGELKMHGEDLFDSEFSDIDYYEFIAKNIVANKDIRIGGLVAENLIFKLQCQVLEKLEIKNKIQGKNLYCEFIDLTCREIDCEELFARSVCTQKLKAKRLITIQNDCENIMAENVNHYNELKEFDSTIKKDSL